MNKAVFNISVLGMIVLLVLSIAFFRQRMLFVDPAFLTFEIINAKWFVFSEHRYGAWITQSIPLIGSWIHLPLKVILVLYSASFYLFYLGTMLVVGQRWKYYGLASLLFFYNILFVSDVFFWPNNEVHQGIAWMILFLGYYHRTATKKSRSLTNHLLLIFLLALSISCHMLVLIPLGFLWFYLLLGQNESLIQLFRKSSSVIYTSLLVGFGLAKYLLSRSTYYDKQKLSNIDDLSFNSIGQTFQNDHAVYISNLLFNEYYLIIPIALSSAIGLIILRKPLLLFLTTLTSFVYALLVLKTFPSGFERSLHFYMESEWMCLSLILATPLLLTIIPKTKGKSIILVGIALVSMLRFSAILDSNTYFEKRYNQLEHYTQYVSQQGVSKALLSTKNQNTEWIMDWGLPTESLVLSAMDNYDQQVSIKLYDSDTIPIADKSTFLTPFKKISIRDINQNYFILDSTIRYKEVLIK